MRWPWQRNARDAELAEELASHFEMATEQRILRGETPAQARANAPREFGNATHLAVVFLPPFLPALGWFHLLGREGALGTGLSSRFLFSELGVVFVLACCFTPIVTALTALGVNGVDHRRQPQRLFPGVVLSIGAGEPLS